jgi:hypothetical protein
VVQAAAQRSDLENTLIFLTPWITAIAIGLRTAKITGELRLERVTTKAPITATIAPKEVRAHNAVSPAATPEPRAACTAPPAAGREAPADHLVAQATPEVLDDDTNPPADEATTTS